MAPHARNRLGAAIALAILLLLAAPIIPIAAAASNCPPGAGSACTQPRALASLSEEEAEEEAEELEAEALEEEGTEGEEAEAAEEEAEWEEEGEEGEEELAEGEEAPARSPRAGGRPKSQHRARQRAAARVSKLSLTGHARAVLRRHHPAASSVAFSFRLDKRSKVHVTLTMKAHAKGHVRRRTVSSLSTTARKGMDHARLRGHAHLAPGRYVLTIAPAGGRSRSIAFHVG